MSERTEAAVGTQPDADRSPAVPAQAGSSAGDDEAAVRISSRPAGARTRVVPAPGAGVLALLALAWLAATLWVLQREISTSVTDAVAMASAAISLPNVVSASLVAGAATGLVAVNLVARAGWKPAASSRWAGALLVSILVGLVAALVMIAGYDGPGSRVLAGTIAAASVVGGALAGVRPTPVVAAVVAGALAAFAVMFGLNFLGADVISGSSMLAALVCGLVAALVPFFYLRRVTRRETTEGGPARWPAYMAAGAGVGLVLLVAELITRVGGAQVLDAVASLSEFDKAYRARLDGERLVFGLVVLFVGAVAATIAFGRTLPSKSSKSAKSVKSSEKDV